MPANPTRTLRYRCVLSLVVLITNTAAPHSSRNGRSLLASDDYPLAMQTVGMVRVISPPSTTQGFRAAVGLSKGGNEASLALDLPPVPSPLAVPVKACSAPGQQQRAVRPNPPLRC